MKNFIFLMGMFIFSGGWQNSFSQNRVDANIIALPPYSPHFIDYAQQPEKIIVQLRNTGIPSGGGLKVKLLFRLEGDNSVLISSDVRHKNDAAIMLPAGSIASISGAQLRQFLDAKHLYVSGIDKKDLLNGMGLPEGNYTLYVQVVDYENPFLIYNTVKCNNNIIIRHIDPPVLIRDKKQNLSSVPSGNIVFSWIPSTTGPGCRYKLTIKEISSKAGNTEDIMRSSVLPVFFEKEIDANTYVYAPDNPRLIPGRSYAWQVTAFYPKHGPLFKNGGRSEVGFFTVEKEIGAMDYYNNCYCYASSSISNTSRASSVWTYVANVQALCSGVTQPVSGPSANADTGCSVSSIHYNWAITSGTNVAQIIAGQNSQEVSVQINGTGTFSLMVEGAVVCSDSTSCSYSSVVTDTATTCTGCTCNLETSVTRSTGTDSLRGYFGSISGNCSGNFKSSGLSTTCDSCGPLKNLDYKWSIISDNSVARIEGPDDQEFVQVRILSNGYYILQFTGSGECQDDQVCSHSSTISDSLIVKQCTCTSGPVEIQPGARQGTQWTYNGTVNGTCTGEYGTSPGLKSCEVLRKEYTWNVSPASIAEIVGSNTLQSVTINIKANGPFSLRLDGTVVCSDSQQCSNYNFYYDTAKLNEPKSCHCSHSDKSISLVNEQGEVRTYEETIVGSCTGQSGPGPDYDSCTVSGITYKWFISEGKGIAEIIGADNGRKVDVKITGTGRYTVSVFGDVICSDSSKCSYEDYISDSIDFEKKCAIKVTPDNLPLMDGGLTEESKKIGKPIERDAFIALTAEGLDFDRVTFECTPSDFCDPGQKVSSDVQVLNSRVRFEWNIVKGEGNFVMLGCLPGDTKKDVGNRVIFMPPYVPLPVAPKTEESVVTEISLKVIDANNADGPLHDPDVIDMITIITKRRSGDPDHYTIEITNKTHGKPNPNVATPTDGICKAVPKWDLKDELVTPEIKLPGVADNSKMVAGQWIRLEAVDQKDPDELSMICKTEPDETCKPAGEKLMNNDNIEYTWEILAGGGKFIGGNTGRYVIYEAPMDIGRNAVNGITVKFKVTVRNNFPSYQQVDKEKMAEKELLKIYRPGVTLQYTPLDWLPQENNVLELTDTLMYFDNGWKQGFAHMCRIHFFDLPDVSGEEGVAMNTPLPGTAEKCRDLLIKNEDDHEAYEDPGVDDCNKKGYFIQARTKKPVRTYKIKIHSEDYGAYGFIRSFANVPAPRKPEPAKSSKPYYKSLTILSRQFSHPDANRKKKHVYDDNRVNIPHDLDENHIADGGWRVTGGQLIADPVNERDDEDRVPVADGYKGDGLTAYEEYRGFKIQSGAHLRTDINRKDVFLYITDNTLLPNIYESLSQLDVHLINNNQFADIIRANKTTPRVINFNFTNARLHETDQSSIRMINGGRNDKFLGLTETVNNHPAPPNWVKEVNIYTQSIANMARLKALNYNNKLAQVIAHELCHANNVYHHGEGDERNQGNSFYDLPQFGGLRSGNFDCIMRYDNVGTPVPNTPQPEAIGSLLCTSHVGTGYNKPDTTFNRRGQIQQIRQRGYGNANEKDKRGSCLHQIRISGRDPGYPKRN